MSAMNPHAEAALKGLAWIGRSPAVQLARTQVWEAAPTDLPVLLLGEPGSGRQLAARMLHALSSRQEGPFIRVDCAAVDPSDMAAVLFERTPVAAMSCASSGAARRVAQRVGPGVRRLPVAVSQPDLRGRSDVAIRTQPSVLAQAHGGTLFLDGVEHLPFEVQQQLLVRIPRPSTISMGDPTGIRLVTAARTDLEREARAGSFCAQLFYRLAILPVILQPLRQRGRDLSLLATYFASQTLARAARPAHELPPATLDALYAHEWPGNVWELKRCCERAALLAGRRPITPEHITKLLEAAPWVHEHHRKPVSRWTSPWLRSPGRN